MSCVTPGGKEQTGEDTVAPATVVTSWHESFSPEAFGLSSFQISWLRNSESDPKCITLVCCPGTAIAITHFTSAGVHC